MPQSIVITSAAVGLAAIAALLWFWWWRFPKRQVDRLRLTIRDPKARADIEDNLRKTIGQLIGGAAVLIGAGLAYLQFTQQQQASQQQFLQQQQVSRDLLISNQVSKGFEQLGSKEIVVRLGGIYALEGVMNTSEQYHQPVLEALSAFVRDRTATVKGDLPWPATDIQAALTVIGRRAAIGTGVPNLENAHIPKANLSAANLNYADLTGANLNYADLTGARLTGAELIVTHLKYANLTAGDNLTQAADLTHADLVGADLTGARLAGAKLTGARLTDAKLTGAFLEDADLTGANLSDVNLSGAYLNGANLSRATVHQTQLDVACGTNVKLNPGLTIKPCR
jgi:uncharacterized protein YjbI with pentapeptide repeats